jgi:hypothetical protein
VKVALGLAKELKLPPLPVIMVQLPVSPAGGELPARVVVVPNKNSWSGPALDGVGVQRLSFMQRTGFPVVFRPFPILVYELH